MTAGAGLDCAIAGKSPEGASEATRIAYKACNRLDMGFSLSSSIPAAALLMPADEPRLAEQEQTIEHVPEHRQREDTGVHLRNLERALRQQGEIAEPVAGYDHL